MRTTLSIDDDVLLGARQLADLTGQSLGAALSDLARRGLRGDARGPSRNGIRLLPPSQRGAKPTLGEVNGLRDDLP